MVKTLYLEDISPEGGVGQLEDVVGSDQVEPRLVLVHRVDNGLGRAKWVKGKYWQTTGGKATKPGSELVNPARPWADNNPPHCKHKNLFVKELEHKIPGKSTLLNSFQEF